MPLPSSIPAAAWRKGAGCSQRYAPAPDKPIRYVISTHAHPDHIFGHAAFENEDAIFLGHRNLPRALAMRGQFYLDAYRRTLGPELMADVKILAPTQVVADVVNLDLGARTLAVKAWPTAHTDNDLTVLDEESGTLFAGDLIVSQHVPVLDGSILGWLRAINDLAQIQARRVLPGHGPVIDNWPGALDEQRRYLEHLTRDVRKLIAHGAPHIGSCKQCRTGREGSLETFRGISCTQRHGSVRRARMGVTRAVTAAVEGRPIRAQDGR